MTHSLIYLGISLLSDVRLQGTVSQPLLPGLSSWITSNSYTLWLYIPVVSHNLWVKFMELTNEQTECWAQIYCLKQNFGTAGLPSFQVRVGVLPWNSLHILDQWTTPTAEGLHWFENWTRPVVCGAWNPWLQERGVWDAHLEEMGKRSKSCASVGSLN